MYIQCNPVLTYSLASENLVRYIRRAPKIYSLTSFILVSRNSLLLVGEREAHVRAWNRFRVGTYIIKCGRGNSWVREIWSLPEELFVSELIIHVLKLIAGTTRFVRYLSEFVKPGLHQVF